MGFTCPGRPGGAKMAKEEEEEEEERFFDVDVYAVLLQGRLR